MSEAIHAGKARTKDETAYSENSIGFPSSIIEVETGE
jgi:hypothetical protein